MKECPSCGAPREGAVRFCNECGLDYWRAAAGEVATPAPAPEPAVAPSSGVDASVFLIAGGFLLVAAAVVAAIVIFSPGSGSTPAAGRPVPTLSEEEHLVRAFFRAARDPDAAFAVTSNATLTFEGLSEPVPATTTTGTVRIHGDDWSGDMTIAQEGVAPVVAEVAYVEGTAYVRESGAPEWTSRELSRAQVGPINPFARISTVLEVMHVGTEVIDGQELQHLQVTKWLGGSDFDDLLVNIAITDQESTLDIWTTAEGIPVSADLVMEVQASDGVESATITSTSHFVISEWDEVEPITAPS